MGKALLYEDSIRSAENGERSLEDLFVDLFSDVDTRMNTVEALKPVLAEVEERLGAAEGRLPSTSAIEAALSKVVGVDEAVSIKLQEAQMSAAQAIEASDAARVAGEQIAPFVKRQSDVAAASDTITPDGGVTDHKAELAALFAAVRRQIPLKAGETYRTTQPLPALGAGSRLLGEGATIAFDYSNGGAGYQAAISRLRNTTFHLPAGRTVRRFLAITEAFGLLEDVAFTSHNQQPEGPSNSDAHVVVGAPDVTLRGLTFRNIDCPIRVSGDRCRIRDLDVENWKKGVRLDNVAADIIGFRFGAISPNAGPNPGCNAFVSGPNGGPTGGVIADGIIEFAAEHGGYFSRSEATRATNPFLLANILIAASGQNGLKLRYYDDVTVIGVHSRDCAFNNSTGTNEDNFHFERIRKLKLVGLRGSRKLKGNCAYDGVLLFGCSEVYGGDLNFDTPFDAGIRIVPAPLVTEEGPDAIGPAEPVRVVYLDGVTVTNSTGVRINHADQTIGDVSILNLTVRDAPAAPLSIVIGAVEAGKRIVITGTYTAAVAPIYPDHPQVDVSGFVPANDTATVAAAATITLAHLASDRVIVGSGATTITSFGIGPRGARRRLVAGVAVTIDPAATGSATVGYSLAAGDALNLRCLGGTSWVAEGPPVAADGSLVGYSPLFPPAAGSPRGGVHVRAPASPNSLGSYGATITMTGGGTARVRAAIAVKHTGNDPDQTGIAFMVHESTGNDETLVEGAWLNHLGDMTLKRGLIQNPFTAARTLEINGQLAIETLTDTTITFRRRGLDGVTRFVTLNLVPV